MLSTISLEFLVKFIRHQYQRHYVSALRSKKLVNLKPSNYGKIRKAQFTVVYSKVLYGSYARPYFSRILWRFVELTLQLFYICKLIDTFEQGLYINTKKSVWTWLMNICMKHALVTCWFMCFIRRSCIEFLELFVNYDPQTCLWNDVIIKVKIKHCKEMKTDVSFNEFKVRGFPSFWTSLDMLQFRIV